MASSVVTQVIVLPGSGCTPTRECNFYRWFGDAIEATGRYKATMENMPDPHVCREKTWIPFNNDQLGGSTPSAWWWVTPAAPWLRCASPAGLRALQMCFVWHFSHQTSGTSHWLYAAPELARAAARHPHSALCDAVWWRQ